MEEAEYRVFLTVLFVESLCQLRCFSTTVLFVESLCQLRCFSTTVLFVESLCQLTCFSTTVLFVESLCQLTCFSTTVSTVHSTAVLFSRLTSCILLIKFNSANSIILNYLLLDLSNVTEIRPSGPIQATDSFWCLYK